MNTVPEKPARAIQPGEHLIEGTDDVVRVQHTLPYTDADGRDMVALTVLPLTRTAEPILARYRPTTLLRLATDAEISAVTEQGRRIELAEALRDVAERILVNRLPIDYQVFDFVLDTRAEVQRWATAYGLPMPEETSPGKTPALQIERDQVRIQVMYVHPDTDSSPAAETPADDPEGYGYSRPAEDDVEPYDPHLPAEGEGRSLTGRTGNTGELPIITSAGGSGSSPAAGAEAGTGLIAPSGPGVAAPGPDTEDQRAAEPGEVCTCGRPATVVYLGGEWGATGHCGIAGTPAGSCPWCGAPDPHIGRCPQYKLRPDAPDTKTAAEGERDTSPSADAASDDPGDRVDGRSSLPVRAAAAPVAPLGVGATGVTPDDCEPGCNGETFICERCEDRMSAKRQAEYLAAAERDENVAEVTPDPHADCDNAGKKVTCDRCKKNYTCTPSSDFYCTPEGDHCCEPCLLAGIGAVEMHVIEPEVGQ